VGFCRIRLQKECCLTAHHIKEIKVSKGNTFENDYMKLIFNNVAIPLIGDASGIQPSATAGNLYLAFHTADPGEGGDQTTSETAYTGYTRMAVARTTGGFTVSANAVNLVANLDFPACTASPGAALTHFSIGVASSGTSKILYSGTATPNVTMAVGVIPRITTAANLVTED
jgi:hypothetical protein